MTSDIEGISSEADDVGELIQLPEEGVVFCDWLDTTFSPSEDLSWVSEFVSSAGGVLKDPGKYVFLQGGVIKHQTGKRWQRLSISGSALSVFRSFGLFDELLLRISAHSYKITRLDAAYDLCIDAAPIVLRLWDGYKGARLKLNAWNLIPVDVQLGTRFDGAITGTFYAGNYRVHKITARVYDKQHELRCKRRFETGPRIRYEITVKTDGPTLRDVSDPSALFWHYASPSLLKAPKDVPSWSPGNPYLWQGSQIAPKSLEDRLKGVVYGSGDLNAAIAICGDSLAMFEYLRKLVSLRISERASRLPGWSASYDV